MFGAALHMPARSPAAYPRTMPTRRLRVPQIRSSHRLTEAGEPVHRPRQATLIGSIYQPSHYHSMGIDIYAEWDGMSEAEKTAQITGFSAEHGHVGYLREAYHGEPYATKVLVPEAFEELRVPIYADTLGIVCRPPWSLPSSANAKSTVSPMTPRSIASCAATAISWSCARARKLRQESPASL